MLHINGLCKKFGDVVAAADVSLRVKPGQIVGFVGPNGAGKSTTMRAIFGLVEPDAGVITWKGQPVEPSLHRFGYMPEQRGLYPKMKVLDQVTFFGRLKGLDRKTAAGNAEELLGSLGLGDRLTDPLEKLSHGNQQRVQLAVSMVNDPEVLVLDEPFNGLDPVALVTLQDALEARVRGGTAVLFSSHQLDLVERLCDEVVLISEGRVRAAGTVTDVRASAGERFVSIEVDRPLVPLADQLPTDLEADGLEVVAASTGAAVVRVGGQTDLTDLTGLLSAAASAGTVTRFDYDLPSLEAAFKQLVEQEQTMTAGGRS